MCTSGFPHEKPNRAFRIRSSMTRQCADFLAFSFSALSSPLCIVIVLRASFHERRVVFMKTVICSFLCLHDRGSSWEGKELSSNHSACLAYHPRPEPSFDVDPAEVGRSSDTKPNTDNPVLASAYSRACSPGCSVKDGPAKVAWLLQRTKIDLRQ